MLRVGVDETDAPRGGAQETYASVLIANDADREVNLNGLTIQWEFTRLVQSNENPEPFTTPGLPVGDFEFTCWGAQIVSSNARRVVD